VELGIGQRYRLAAASGELTSGLINWQKVSFESFFRASLFPNSEEILFQETFLQ
jgi:hypothetical protein